MRDDEYQGNAKDTEALGTDDQDRYGYEDLALEEARRAVLEMRRQEEHRQTGPEGKWLRAVEQTIGVLLVLLTLAMGGLLGWGNPREVYETEGVLTYMPIPVSVSMADISDSSVGYVISMGKLRDLFVYNCPKLRFLIMPNTRLGSYGYHQSDTTEIPFPRRAYYIDITDCQEVKEITIPPETYHVRIKNCPKLEKLKLPESITELRIENCDKLTGVNLPESITDLCINRCDSIKEIPIPKSIEEVEIQGCDGLETVIWPESVDRSRVEIKIEKNPMLKGYEGEGM